MLSDFIKHCWHAGFPRGNAGDAISATLAVYPELKRSLPESWYMLSVWSRIELPTRAPPLPTFVLLGMIGAALKRGSWPMAFLLSLSFDCALRTGEILQLAERDVHFDTDGSTGVVNLLFTKSGQRHGAFEALTITEGLVYRLWKLHCSHRISTAQA